jgi:DNA-binding response OmpR family regulator
MKNSGSSHAGEPGGISAELGSNPPPARVLLVDDDSDIRRLNAEATTGSGYHVDGAPGWEALNTNRNDFFITENDAPKLSEMELIN